MSTLPRGRREELLRLAIEHAARAHLRVRVVHRRVRAEAEALHVVGHRAVPELLGDLRPDGVDGVRQRRRQRDRSVLRVGEVRQRRRPRSSSATCRRRRRLGRELAAVQRRRRGDDLHRRARRVAALRRAVEQRRVRVVGRELRVDAAARRARWGRSRACETITRTLPVAGSIATTEPLRPCSACDRDALRLGVEVRDEAVADALARRAARRRSTSARCACRSARRCARAPGRRGRCAGSRSRSRARTPRPRRCSGGCRAPDVLEHRAREHAAVARADDAAVDALLLDLRARGCARSSR